ncbi:MAG: glycosyltransferase family 4 protein [Bacteroidales bacterium]|nr:glycosyltransferase family 4 protein [Bacteroidales bacterium]
MKKILALAFLPYWKGGKQTSGLATGIFDLHDAVNSLHGQYEVVLACTDVNTEEKMVDSTKVIGWNSKLLLRHCLKKFYRLPRFFRKSLYLRNKYQYPFSKTFVKALFLDYAIEREMPNAIHFHGITNAYYVELLWNNRLPAILRLHGMNGYNDTVPGYLNYRKKEKDVITLPYKMVTFISEKNRSDWGKYYGGFNCPTRVVLNGYNSSLFFYKEEDNNIQKKYDLITIAAIDRNKGQERVIEALRILKEQGREFSYLIIGTGRDEYVEQLKESVNKYNLDVTFLPHCSQEKLRDFLIKSRYFIMPSAAEGFGKVFIESLACGIPVILPQSLPIVDEHILDHTNSVLLEDEKSKSIVSTLLLIGTYELCSAAVISQSVSRLSWNNIGKQYCDNYLNNGI